MSFVQIEYLLVSSLLFKMASAEIPFQSSNHITLITHDEKVDGDVKLKVLISSLEDECY